MPSSSRTVTLVDDWRLVARVVGVPLRFPRRAAPHTTTYWYYRACRAAVTGAGGHLSGPFTALDPARQAAAVEAIVELAEDVQLPDPRPLVPSSPRWSASTAATPNSTSCTSRPPPPPDSSGARVLLSRPSASGALPDILDAERIRWDTLGP